MKAKDLFVFASQVNREVFNNAINLDGLKIRICKVKQRDRLAYAWYYPGKNRIDFFPHLHKTEFDAFTTIAHELIHVYQKQKSFDDYGLNHGGKFFRYFADKICKEYEIDRKGFK